MAIEKNFKNMEYEPKGYLKLVFNHNGTYDILLDENTKAETRPLDGKMLHSPEIELLLNKALYLSGEKNKKRIKN